jgi:hypothetical protein
LKEEETRPQTDKVFFLELTIAFKQARETKDWIKFFGSIQKTMKDESKKQFTKSHLIPIMV